MCAHEACAIIRSLARLCVMVGGFAGCGCIVLGARSGLGWSRQMQEQIHKKTRDTLLGGVEDPSMHSRS